MNFAPRKLLSVALFAALAAGGGLALGCQPDDEPGAYHQLNVEYTADGGLYRYKLEPVDAATAWPPHLHSVNFALWVYPDPDPIPGTPDVSTLEFDVPPFLANNDKITAPIPTYAPIGPQRFTLNLQLSRPGPWKLPIRFKNADGGEDSAEIVLEVRE